MVDRARYHLRRTAAAFLCVGTLSESLQHRSILRSATRRKFSNHAVNISECFINSGSFDSAGLDRTDVNTKRTHLQPKSIAENAERTFAGIEQSTKRNRDMRSDRSNVDDA